LCVGVGNLRIVRLRKRTLRLVSIAVLSPILAIAIAFSVPAAKRVAHRRAESIACGNYMVSIMFAARLWASDHGEELPPKLLMMSNELNSPKILHCPGDHKRQRVGGWLEFTDADSSYEILTASTPDGYTNAAYLRCRVHRHLGYADGTVFDGKERRRKKMF
jgi:hypothetical protein